MPPASRLLQLGDALLVSTQAATELNLQQKLREDAALRVDELEESLLEKDQELQRLRSLVGRLQGEVRGAGRRHHPSAPAPL